MSEDRRAFQGPRVAGMHEHLKRVKMFLQHAHSATDPEQRFRFLMAGVHFARGIVELMLEAADMKQVDATRTDLKDTLPDKLPWYALIEKIRIHDFHRFGLIPPNPNMRVTFLGGPIELQAQRGAAVYRIEAGKPKTDTTGASNIKEQRPLLSSDGKFFDDETQQYVSLEQVLSDYVKAAPAIIEGFEEQVRC